MSDKKATKVFDVSRFTTSCKFYTAQPVKDFADSLENFLEKKIKTKASGMFEIIHVPYVPDDSFMMVDANGKPIGMYKNVELEV